MEGNPAVRRTPISGCIWLNLQRRCENRFRLVSQITIPFFQKGHNSYAPPNPHHLPRIEGCRMLNLNIDV